jgi:8-oxo-dGTP diphosphatase
VTARRADRTVRDMAAEDGNGWVFCRCGHRHWGRFGAAGLVLVRPSTPPQVLMQLRAGWTHEGGSWALPGGARDSHESAEQTAVREAEEEAGTDPARLRIVGTTPGADHGDWAYTYVLAIAADDLRSGAGNAESAALTWVDVDEVADLQLHPALAAAWPDVRSAVGRALDEDTPAETA